jgi:hypothetical protein
MKKETKAVLVLITLSILVALAVFFILCSPFFTGNVVAEEEKIEEIFACLEEKEIILYIRANDMQSEAQINLLGKYKDIVTIVDCVSSAEKCRNVWIYPSWEMDGNLITGGLSPAVLVNFAGCR